MPYQETTSRDEYHITFKVDDVSFWTGAQNSQAAYKAARAVKDIGQDPKITQYLTHLSAGGFIEGKDERIIGIEELERIASGKQKLPTKQAWKPEPSSRGHRASMVADVEVGF